MKLVPREVEKLVLHSAGALAQKRLARGLQLNYPETVALIASQVQELIRDGKSVAELMDLGRTMLGRRNVLPSVAALLEVVQVEGTFPDGTKLVTIHHPIASEEGDLQLALYGSFLPVPSIEKFPAVGASSPSSPGSYLLLPDSPILLNAGRQAVRLTVRSTCDRPIQIGSHYHFVETNPYLVFDRRQAYGKRLNILAGTAVRFEPGEVKTVVLVSIGGKKRISGGNALAQSVTSTGELQESAVLPAVMQAVTARGFGHIDEPDALTGVTGGPAASDSDLSTRVPRWQYAAVFGPTAGDGVRLGNTGLVAVVERDLTHYGDECKFGGGKVLREGMGQQAGAGPLQALDTVLTNALIVDYTGIYKADIGIKGTRIAGIGKAGNPDVMEGVSPGMVVGVTTEVIAAEGLIVTAGGVDTHVHFICPQLVETALCGGVTTLVGGGTGPAHGTLATTCTPNPLQLRNMLRATDGFPVNIGLTGKGNTSSPEGLREIVEAGAIGLKLHEDWGTTPAAIDTCLTLADSMDIQVTIHTDTLNESACLEHTIEAFKGRTIHTYHSEGAGGGHAPDIIRVCSEPNVLPSSTNPTRPFTVNTIDEHLDMLMVCHHLDGNIREDVAFAESRIRAETIAAEDILHDMGAISMMSSDSQAMGRIGEVVTRTWQTAHKMKEQRGPLPGDQKQTAAVAESDNERIKRYIAKYTINPAIAHGFGQLLGSVEVGKLADLVLWHPGFFGAKPEIVVKGGMIAWAQMGDANASIPTPEPVLLRPQFGAQPKPAASCSYAFVSKACMASGKYKDYGLEKEVVAIEGVRTLGKKDMKLNSAMPKLTVDPETYQVKLDGETLLTCEPAQTLPLAQDYFLF